MAILWPGIQKKKSHISRGDQQAYYSVDFERFYLPQKED